MPKSARPVTVVVGVMLVVFAGSLETGCRNQPAATSTTSDASQTPSAQPPAAEKKGEADPLAFDPSTAATNDLGEPIRKGSDFPVATPFLRDTRTFKIAPLDGVEFNYRMEKGGTMVYSWTASDFVNWDFHGEPKGSKPDYAESYAMGEGKEGNGAFIAPTSGIHGWFWENQGTKPVTLTLKTAGHFSEGLLTMPDDTKAPKPFDRR